MDPVSLLKYSVLLLASPIWYPFAKELWNEFKMAMREDGGIFGAKPTPKKRKAIQAEVAQEPPAQVHIIKPHYGVRQRRSASAQSAPVAGPQLGSRGRRPMGR